LHVSYVKLLSIVIDFKLIFIFRVNLDNRTFSTFDFYRSKEDIITPAGLAFYQTDWDNSLKKFYHDKLSMSEPVYEYDFPSPYIKPQKWFPLKEPFNL